MTAIVAVVIALNALGNGFPNDDQWIVAEAKDLQHPSQWWHALTRPWWPYANALWRPVTTLQLAIETWLGGGAATPYHAINALWHGAASALVVALALRIAPPVAAAAAGLFFALHPIHVEPIATLVGRADLSVTVFLLLAAHIASRRAPLTRELGWQIAACAFAALGSKESGVAAPLIVWAASRLVRPTRESFVAAAWAAAGIVPLLIGRWFVLGTLGGDEPHPAWVGLAPGVAIPFALRSLAVGAGWLTWPRPPVFEHAPPERLILAPEAWLVAVGTALVAAAAWAAWRQWRRPAPMALALLWWWATILPVSNLVFRSGIVLADRVLYAPSVGAALALAALLSGLPAARGLQRAAIGATVAVAAYGGVLTWRDLPVWKDSETLIAAFVTRAPESWSGYLFRGLARTSTGDRAGAIADYDRGIALFPREGRLLRERAKFALQDGDSTRAIDWLERSVAVYPKAIRTRQILLDIYRRRGDAAARCRLLVPGVALAADQRRWQQELAELRTAGQCR
ncbi:MAG: hypothetical protein SFW08_12605 [Gemmatimonadaceae bacterium]|nr:hypothetical protein [Gemmatimonadaceae bacterium]